MIYPEFPKKDDVIGICAPSAGVGSKTESFDKSLDNIRARGFRTRETASVRNDSLPSAPADVRGDEFNELIKDDDVRTVIAATGGDYDIDILPYVDQEALKASPKWVMGASDPTNLTYFITTKLDIASLYGQNAGSFDTESLHVSLEESLDIISGNVVVQHSYSKYDGKPSFDKDEPDLNTDVYWTVLTPPAERGSMVQVSKVDKTHHMMKLSAPAYEVMKNPELESVVSFSEFGIPKDMAQLVYLHGYSEAPLLNVSGRLIGGCADCIQSLLGTPYDGGKDFVDKYGDEGIIWYFDPFNMSASAIYYLMTQMKFMGYFRNTKAIIFGRVMMKEGSEDAEYAERLTNCFIDYDADGNGSRIPIIWNADIGHVKPAMTLINGSYATLRCKNGAAELKMELK